MENIPKQMLILGQKSFAGRVENIISRSKPKSDSDSEEFKSANGFVDLDISFNEQSFCNQDSEGPQKIVFSS
jgi:hypothetical protein